MYAKEVQQWREAEGAADKRATEAEAGNIAEMRSELTRSENLKREAHRVGESATPTILQRQDGHP